MAYRKTKRVNDMQAAINTIKARWWELRMAKWFGFRVCGNGAKWRYWRGKWYLIGYKSRDERKEELSQYDFTKD